MRTTEKLNPILRKLILIIVCFSITSNGKAQIQQPKDNFRHIAKTNVGYDYNLVSIDVGYAYYWSEFKIAGFIDITQGTALLGTGNLRTQVGLQTWQGSFQKFNLSTSFAFVYVRSSNKAGSYDGLGLNLHLNAGVKLNRMGLGTDIQYNPFLSTYVRHSDFWRQYYYNEAKDGWYHFTASTWRIGGYFSTVLNAEQSLEISLRGGYQTSGQFDKLIPGFYTIIGLNKKFN